MPERSSSFSIRSFREGDEDALAPLFNRYMEGFFGPIQVTPKAWRKEYRTRSWTGPSLKADGDCVRIAEREGRVIGYAVMDYSPDSVKDGAVVQELCVTVEGGAGDVVDALLADAESRALGRGKSLIEASLSPEDGRTAEALSIDSSHEVQARDESPRFEEVDYVKGVENPTEASHNILRWLVQHDYSDQDIGKTVGLNILRVLKEVWQ